MWCVLERVCGGGWEIDWDASFFASAGTIGDMGGCCGSGEVAGWEGGLWEM